jgi:dethiobiotin synthetase
VSALVVTGTDTGVGKTLVTAAVAAGLAARGMRIAVAKPVETGCGAGGPADARVLAAAAGAREPLDVVCRYRFPEPLAPVLAADRAGATVDVEALVTDLSARARTCDLLLVEGAGGLLVPLTRAASYADLAARLAAPLLLVVGSRLGAINHALLTLEVMARRRLASRGYVVSRLAPAGDAAVDSNTGLLAALTAVPCRGELPWLPEAAALLAALAAGGADAPAARARLAALAEERLDLDALVTRDA